MHALSGQPREQHPVRRSADIDHDDVRSLRRKRVAARARRKLELPPLVITDDLLERVAALTDPVLALVEELPGAQREALHERVVEERDYTEIAKELRCSEAVVRKRVSRALSTLRERAEKGTR